MNSWPSGKYVHLLYMYSILGRGSFCFNYCLNSAWHGGDQFVALLRWYGSPGFFDSGLQVICIVYIYIYIYAFSRRFYPKRLTLHSSYSFTFDQLLLSLGIEPMILALLAPCSTIWARGKLNPDWCLSSSSWQYPIDCLWGSGQASLLANQAQ